VEPRCAVHPDRPAAGTCQRCGAFACVEDYAAVAGRWLCAPCAARPDADYLEAFRRKYWGKRDAWAWLMGLGAVGHVVEVGQNVASGQPLFIPMNVAVGAAQVCYFLGPRWARALIFVPVVGIALTPLVALLAVPSDAVGMGVVSAALTDVIFRPLVPGLICLAIFLSTRNQLFFRVPVSQVKLKKAWDLYSNNTIVRVGFLLSLVGVLVPGLGVPGLVLSWVGLTRVDPDAFPPIGGRRRAIAGIVLGAVGVLGWGTAYGMLALRRQ
jgi:hypothetical protein